MTKISPQDFLRAVLKSRLVDKEALERRQREFVAEKGGKEVSAERLARFLVDKGDLTQYQAERLLAGRSQGFFLGNCLILDRLGAGGMGTVYKAKQLKLGGRLLALKVLPAEHVKDAEFVARFQREACAVAALKHPNVVQVFDVGQEGTVHYMIMELVEGVNLLDRIETEGPLSISEALDVVEQTARGLEHAHAQGIIHRDIKPANLIREGGTVKILDLGLARGAKGQTALTKEIKGMGTADYMSPEQFRDAHRVDQRSDLYSLGCTWYHLLAGRPPFEGADPVAKGVAHLLQAPTSIQELCPHVPDGVAAMIERLLAKKPEDRYASCGELLADIARWRQQNGQPSPTTSSPNIPQATVATTAKRRKETDRAVSAKGKRTDSAPVLVPATSESHETLIRTPGTGIPTMLLYLIPLLGALVLGGVYIGIRMLRDEFQEKEPVIVEGGKRKDQGNKHSDDKKSAGPKKDKKENKKPPKKKDRKPPPKKTDDKSNRDGTGKPPPIIKKKRPARTWMVGLGEDDEPTVAGAWAKTEDGDTIALDEPGPTRVGPLQAAGKRLTLLGRGKDRPALLLELPDKPAPGQGLWRIEDGGLSFQGVDIFLDLRKRKENTELILFELIRSDFQLIDSSITVLRGPALGLSQATAIKLVGERPWDAKARGNAPPALRVELQNALVRGPQTIFYLDSRQARIVLENSVLCTPGTVGQFFHTRAVQFAHHRLDFEIAGCTVDVDGPLVTIDCRPFDLKPTPLRVQLSQTFLASGIKSKSLQPAQIYWQSPVKSEVVSGAVMWQGKSNAFFRRGNGLQSRSVAGPLEIYVETHSDWARLKLGDEANSILPVRDVRMPIQKFWHGRLPGDYYHPGRKLKPPIGADPKTVVKPRLGVVR